MAHCYWKITHCNKHSVFIPWSTRVGVSTRPASPLRLRSVRRNRRKLGQWGERYRRQLGFDGRAVRSGTWPLYSWPSLDFELLHLQGHLEGPAHYTSWNFWGHSWTSGGFNFGSSVCLRDVPDFSIWKNYHGNILAEFHWFWIIEWASEFAKSIGNNGNVRNTSEHFWRRSSTFDEFSFGSSVFCGFVRDL